MSEAAERISTAIDAASRGLVDRRVLVELIALSAVAREHLLVIGPPGTAKSEAVRRIARALGGSYFEYLLGRFTEPSEIFGPIDLRKLKDGIVETETRGMLPEAEIAFLDEVFLGSTAILNTLLAVLHERRFRRGSTALDVPLRICVGASNALPDDPGLAAFADRFLVRVFVEPVADPDLETLLAGGYGLRPVEQIADIDTLDQLSKLAQAADPSGIRPLLADCVRKLRLAGVDLSDRRVVKLQRLVCAAAALSGREKPTAADLWPIVYAVPDLRGQELAREALREVLAEADSATLAAAAEDASAGPLVRARRLVSAATDLFGETPADDPWKRRAEAILREIDAGFTADRLPPDLREARTKLTEAVRR